MKELNPLMAYPFNFRELHLQIAFLSVSEGSEETTQRVGFAGRYLCYKSVNRVQHGPGDPCCVCWCGPRGELEAGGPHLVKSSFVAFWHAQRASKG